MARSRNKADRQDDYTECVRVTADDRINWNIDGVDMTTANPRPKNTNDQYRPKILDFKDFYHIKYDGEGDTRVMLKKVQKFLSYQDQRQKRK
jgi:hypothetical protein